MASTSSQSDESPNQMPSTSSQTAGSPNQMASTSSQSAESPPITVVERRSSFQRRMRVVSLVNGLYIDVNFFLIACLPYFKAVFEKCPQPIVKTFSCLSIQFVKPTNGDINEATLISHLKTASHVLNITQDMDEFYTTNIQDKLLCKLSEFQNRDSGWTIKQITY